ncbi:MAG TPA: sigma 54-interacting transcriptional regulator [Blastocatellia bacterium]|nr:sigma 54-interacting transcriptional regulator [Blastocatellia bacterium]
MTTIWHHFLGRDEARPDNSILDSLSQAGIELSPVDPLAPGRSGLLWFDGVTADLCNFLSTASGHGLRRVLAVARSRSDLDHRGIWRLLQAGASDVFAWDHSADPAREVAARFERWGEIDEITQSSLVRSNLAGRSPAWVRVMRQIVEVARFSNASILITGESGTGKELVARLIHTLDSRPHKRNLIVSDCTTVVPELAGSEFFGHERGAFTGAVAARDGAFALADGGTLFLDEVGELPLNLQAELLRVVQERTYKRVGGNGWQKTDFRLICATNRDLFEEQTRGQFRRDLYYRIASWTGRLPSLRERREDIPVLARHFIEQLRPDAPLELDDVVRDYLLTREYPGNVRDLKQLMTRIVQRHVGPGPITAGDIPEDERPREDHEMKCWSEGGLEGAVRLAVTSGVSLKEIERLAGELAERIVIEEEQGNLQRAAARLGVTDRALQLRRAARKLNGAG